MGFFSGMMQKLCSRYTFYILQAGLLFCAPYNLKNWYSLSVHIFSMLFSHIPRYLFRKFQRSRPQITVMNNTLIFLAYSEDVFGLIFTGFMALNYMPGELLTPFFKNQRTCAINSILNNVWLVITSMSILVLSLLRLMLNISPFWYAGLDHENLTVMVYMGVPILSLGFCLTGYRLVTRDYCDIGIYNSYLTALEIEVLKDDGDQNYPDLYLFLALAILLHVISVGIEWKHTKLNPIRKISPQSKTNKVNISKLTAEVETRDPTEGNGNVARNQSKQIQIKQGSRNSEIKGSRSSDGEVFETNKYSKRPTSESEHNKEHRSVTFEKDEISDRNKDNKVNTVLSLDRKDRNRLETNIKLQKQTHTGIEDETGGETLQVQTSNIAGNQIRNQFETPKERAAYLPLMQL